jgi:pyruvate,water dikinase
VDKLYWLDKIQPQDRTKVGDKAFYLSRIMQRGYPVMGGFVVPADVWREFLETLNNSETLVSDLPYSSLHLDINNWRQLQQVASRLRQEVITATVPPQLLSTAFNAARNWETSHLILRPSIVAPALQGLRNISSLLESQTCRCNEQAIALALKRTWSQIFRARSLLYCQRTGIDLQQISLAVLVQPLRNGLASGILNANPYELEIQATWGLGMAITNGEVLPDVYYIEESIVRERQLGNKMVAYGLDIADSRVIFQPPPETVQEIDDSGLVAYLLEEAQQKEYALPEEYLEQLIELANQLIRELGTTFAIKWTISEETRGGRKLSITQVSTPQFVSSHIHVLKGLGAGVGCVTANSYVIANSQQKPEQLPKGAILVAPFLLPEWLPLIQNSAGIITEQGGLTSHAAILARELSIPAVVSVPNATKIIKTGERLLLDGNKGEIYRLSMGNGNFYTGEKGVQETKEHPNGNLEKISSPNHPTPNPNTSSSSPSLPQQPIIATQLLVNLSQPSLIEQVKTLPIDGVGLLRSELMVLNILDGQHPHTWINQGKQEILLQRWCEQITQFVSAFTPRPIFYRSLDWRAHELPSFSQTIQFSSQPLLGSRGTFSYMENPVVFELELAALASVQKAGNSNIHLVLPFVRTVEEFNFCRGKVEQAGLTQVPQFQLWIMAEVPSVLFLLPEYVKAGVQGISIGTNDLTQLLLGVDREQGELAKAFDERHPVVMGAIAQLIEMARNAGIPCSICGQAPALYPEIIQQLVQWGITSISVEPEAVSRTYYAIARAEHQLILEAARKQYNSSAINIGKSPQ